MIHLLLATIAICWGMFFLYGLCIFTRNLFHRDREPPHKPMTAEQQSMYDDLWGNIR